MEPRNSALTADEMFRDCLAVRVRLIGRAVTEVYDRAVEQEGLTIAQVNMLVALSKVGQCSPTKLGSVLQLERSTVSRNLERLYKLGLIEPTSSDGKGIREIDLTALGERKIRMVYPHWKAAQKEASRLLGRAGVDAVQNIAVELWQPVGI